MSDNFTSGKDFPDLPLHRDSEGRTNKEVFLEMAEQFRNPAYRIQYRNENNFGIAEEVMAISAELAEQMAQFFEDMANAVVDPGPEWGRPKEYPFPSAPNLTIPTMEEIEYLNSRTPEELDDLFDESKDA